MGPQQQGQATSVQRRKRRRLVDGPRPRPVPLSLEEVAETVMERTLVHPSEHAVVLETEAYMARERAEETRQHRARLARLLRASKPRRVEPVRVQVVREPPSNRRITASSVRTKPLSQRAQCPTLRPALEIVQEAREAARRQTPSPPSPATIAGAVLPGCDVREIGPTKDPWLFHQFWTAHLQWAQSHGDIAIATAAMAMLARAKRVGVPRIVGVHVHLRGVHHAVWIDTEQHEVVATASPAHAFLPLRTPTP